MIKRISGREIKTGKNSNISENADLYKCEIGDNSKIHSYAFIEEGVKIGSGCIIKPFVYIPTGVTIGDKVFIGPGVVFTNDKYPRTGRDWKLLKTHVEDGVSIGAGSVILSGIRIGRKAMIGAGSVVTNDIPGNSLAYGCPARVVKDKGNV